LLRQGVRFHNGEPVTADDVKFSLERYRGVSAKMFKDRIQHVQIVDPQRLRIRLKDAWPDFLTFYGTPATRAAWVVPRKYVERSATTVSSNPRRISEPWITLPSGTASARPTLSPVPGQ
jgi:ABC-type transport system substrate-binding protein